MNLTTKQLIIRYSIILLMGLLIGLFIGIKVGHITAGAVQPGSASLSSAGLFLVGFLIGAVTIKVKGDREVSE